ncbi:hypothetical protein [Streptomyces sp. NBC_00258]|uniref:hypothetical protein n=1 Tax=Streptomyces sp. NBC_00258 TaxID=2903642 RepID=UPI002E2A1328|nr:hypothetical protein [Streptomyces sp. NBC_00258]
MHPDQAVQFIAVRDVGRNFAAVFGSSDRYAGRTMEIAGDALTGKAVAEHLPQAAGRAISCSRLPTTVLAREGVPQQAAAVGAQPHATTRFGSKLRNHRGAMVGPLTC